MRGIGRLARLEQTQIDAPGFDRQCRITTGATGEWNRVRQIVEVPVGNVLARPFLQRFVARRRLIQRRSCSAAEARSEEHTSELQSLMRISYAVFCLKKKTITATTATTHVTEHC